MTNDLTKRRFGRLRVQWPTGRKKHGRGTTVCWLCVCVCGRLAIVVSHHLRSGNTKGCGHCTRGQHGKTHGHAVGYTTSPTYMSWYAMRQRCTNRKNNGWKYYGERGIRVCRHWLNSFENFLADMGLRPEGTTLGRFFDKGNYTPLNCKWMTSTEQGENRKKKG